MTRLEKSCIGAVLAGGRSRRMGRPKMFLELPDGRTMLQAVGDALSAVCTDVVIVGFNDPGNTLLPYPNIPDRSPGKGPLSGIEVLLASGRGEGYLIAACDQPMLSPELLALLIQGDQNRARFFFASYRSEIHTLPAYVPAGCLPDLHAVMSAGDLSVYAFAEAVRPELVPVPAETAWQLANINTPEEFAVLYSRWGGAHAAAR